MKSKYENWCKRKFKARRWFIFAPFETIDEIDMTPRIDDCKLINGEIGRYENFRVIISRPRMRINGRIVPRSIQRKGNGYVLFTGV